MKQLLIFLFLFLVVSTYSQTTGSYWKVTNKNTLFNQNLPDSVIIYEKDSAKFYYISHVTGVLSTQNMAFAWSQGWVRPIPKDLSLYTLSAIETDPKSFHKADSNTQKNPITLKYFNDTLGFRHKGNYTELSHPNDTLKHSLVEYRQYSKTKYNVLDYYLHPAWTTTIFQGKYDSNLVYMQTEANSNPAAWFYFMAKVKLKYFGMILDTQGVYPTRDGIGNLGKQDKRWDTTYTNTIRIKTLPNSRSDTMLVDSSGYVKKQLAHAVYEYEITTNAENNITIPFALKPTSLVFYNSQIIGSTRWSGSGTTTLNVSLDTRKNDKIIIQM